jgi:hypothetical protein
MSRGPAAGISLRVIPSWSVNDGLPANHPSSHRNVSCSAAVIGGGTTGALALAGEFSNRLLPDGEPDPQPDQTRSNQIKPGTTKRQALDAMNARIPTFPKSRGRVTPHGSRKAFGDIVTKADGRASFKMKTFQAFREGAILIRGWIGPGVFHL